MSELFGTSTDNIGLHLKNIYKERELDENATTEEFSVVRQEGSRIKRATKSIVLIDNFVDESVLTLFSKNQNIDVTIYTKNISKQLKLDLKRHNAQYKPIEIKPFKESHDRFMIIDERDVYHFGASLKDLGKKWFAFSRFDMGALEMLGRLS